MEKVNIRFNNNGTVTYQHKKILEFMPHLSVISNDEVKLTVPNIPLLVSHRFVYKYNNSYVFHVYCFVISDIDYTSK